MKGNLVMLRCANCGTVSQFERPANWGDAVIKDLDGRPFETELFSIENAVSCCPKCSYVSFDVSKNILRDRSILTMPEYLEILQNKKLPTIVNQFIALGFLHERQRETYHSAHAYLCAAWILGDVKLERESMMLLEKSAYCLLQFINSEDFKDHPNLFLLQNTIDVLRRIGKYDNAKKLATYALNKKLPKDIKTNMLLEISLCDNFIRDSHEILPKESVPIDDFSMLFAKMLTVENADYLQKTVVFNEVLSYLKDCKIENLKDGLDMVVLEEKNLTFDYAKLRQFKDLANGSVYSKTEGVVRPFHPKILTSLESLYGKQEVVEKVEPIKEMGEEVVMCENTIEERMPDFSIEKEVVDYNAVIDPIFSSEDSGFPIVEKFEETVELSSVEKLIGIEEVVESNLTHEDEVEEIHVRKSVFDPTPLQEFVSEKEKDLPVEYVDVKEVRVFFEEAVVIERAEPIEEAIMIEKAEPVEEVTPVETREPMEEFIPFEICEPMEEFIPVETREPMEEFIPVEMVHEEEQESNEAIRNSVVQAKNEGVFEHIVQNETVEATVAHSEPVSEMKTYSDGYVLTSDNLNIILTLAEIDGNISISEIQALFDIGYVKAREMLSYVEKSGHIKESATEDTYNFIRR